MSKIIKAAFRDGLIIGFVGGVMVSYAIVIIVFLINNSNS